MRQELSTKCCFQTSAISDLRTKCIYSRRYASVPLWAIQEGKEAAKAVDESLMGYINL